jgi:hypothetical protein
LTAFLCSFIPFLYIKFQGIEYYFSKHIGLGKASYICRINYNTSYDLCSLFKLTHSNDEHLRMLHILKALNPDDGFVLEVTPIYPHSLLLHEKGNLEKSGLIVTIRFGH